MLLVQVKMDDRFWNWAGVLLCGLNFRRMRFFVGNG